MPREPLARRVQWWLLRALFRLAGALLFLRVLASSWRLVRLGPRARAEPLSAAEVAGAEADGPLDDVRPAWMATARVFLPDVVVYASAIARAPGGWRYPLPPHFREAVVDAAPRVRIACCAAFQPAASSRGCLILVPGMFNTARQNVMLTLARQAFYQRGFDVVVPDLRDFGATARWSDAPSSGGWMEGGDVLAVARWARQRCGAPVFVCGFSFGGAVALHAAAAARGEIAGAVAFCPFADLSAMLERLAPPVTVGDPLFLFALFYNWLVRRLAARRGARAASFREYVETVAAPFYGMAAGDLARRASPESVMPSIAVPTVIAHAADDPVIPVRDSVRLLRAARGNPNVRLLLRRRGGHFTDWMTAPDRVWEVVGRMVSAR